MKLKGSHRTCATVLLEGYLSACQLVRAHLLDLLTGCTRDQSGVKRAEQRTYTHCGGRLER